MNGPWENPPKSWFRVPRVPGVAAESIAKTITSEWAIVSDLLGSCFMVNRGNCVTNILKKNYSDNYSHNRCKYEAIVKYIHVCK